MFDDPVHETTDETVVVLGNVVQVARVHHDCTFQRSQLLEQIDDLLEVSLVPPVKVGTALDAVSGHLDSRVDKLAIVHHHAEFVVRLALNQRQDVRYRYLG
ncbi:hypothetical protein D3C76_335950 [compost metagenome]